MKNARLFGGRARGGGSDGQHAFAEIGRGVLHAELAMSTTGENIIS